MRNVCAFAHGGTFWNEEESGEQSEWLLECENKMQNGQIRKWRVFLLLVIQNK
jgi:hypothetical protein